MSTDRGSERTTTSPAAIGNTQRNDLRFRRSKVLKDRYRIFEIIRRPTTTTMAAASPERSRSFGGSGNAKTTEATAPAAAGEGSPTKNLRSCCDDWMLYRASRAAAQATKRNAASQPNLPNGASDQAYARSAGATPKETTSASESNCTPNSEVVPVSLAMRPSTPSSTPATMISLAASP